MNAGIVLTALLTMSALLQFWLAARQFRYLQRLAERRLREAGRARVAFAFSATALEFMLTLGLTLGGGIAYLDGFWHDRPAGAAGLVASVVLASVLLHVALRIAHARIVEASLDVARFSLKELLARASRPILPIIIVAAAAGQALAWLMMTAPSTWWLWATLLWTAGLIARVWLISDQPGGGLGMPLLPSSQPLTDPRLAPRLAAALARYGLAGSEIRITVSPPGALRANARLAGTGRSRHVELSDTLLYLLTPAEVEAVLAHEAGHWRCRHVIRDLANRALLSMAGFGALALAMHHPWILREMAIPDTSPAAWLAAAVALAPLAAVLATPLRAHWRRQMEYEADAFAATHADKQALMRALEKLDASNATDRAADPIYARFYHFHPSQTDRRRRLDTMPIRE